MKLRPLLLRILAAGLLLVPVALRADGGPSPDALPPRSPDPAVLRAGTEVCLVPVAEMIDAPEAARAAREGMPRSMSVRPRHGRFLSIEDALHVWVLGAWVPIDWDGSPTVMWVPCSPEQGQSLQVLESSGTSREAGPPSWDDLGR